MPSGFSRRFSSIRRFVLVAVAGFMLALAAAMPGWAQRPSAMKLFPQNTLLFVRMANAKEFGERLKESSTGRMLNDPQIKPFIDDLYGKAGDLYAEQAQKFMGISWDDLQNLPQGEVAFAIVARPGQMPAFLLLVDQGDGPSAATKLLDRGLEVVAQQGGEFSSEKIGDVEITVVRDADHANRVFGVFERENTIVIATDPDVLRGVLWHWDNGPGAAEAEPAPAASAESTEESSTDDAAKGDGEAEEGAAEFVPGLTLAENTKFTSILRQCRRPQDPPPHVIFFVDPIEMVYEFGQESRGVTFTMGFLSQLGVDGLLGMGGTATFAVGPFEDLAHYHVLLENPRTGIMQLVTFESGDHTPEPFVPFDVENYFTGRWNAPVFYDRLEEMVDKLLGAETFKKRIAEPFAEAMEIDLRADVIDNLAGRITLFSMYEKPAHFRSQKYTLAVELVDEEAARKSLGIILEKHRGEFEERQFGDVKYYAMTPDWLMDMPEEERPFSPFVAIADGHLFLGGSCQLFEQAIAARDGTIDRLAESDDYTRVTSTLGREAAGLETSLFMLTRAEESMRHLYELLTSEKTREVIESQAEENPAFAALSESMKEHQLPPFDALIQYYGPGGGILYDTDTGYHAIAFTLRDEAAP